MPTGRNFRAAPRGRRKSQRRLAEVGITDEDVPQRMPFQLSGGMCQRVALAAALARDPELLIADEPSTALDVTTQAEIMKLLKRVQDERGMSLILITHDLRLAFSTCDRVYVLYAGSLLEVGATRERGERPAASLYARPAAFRAAGGKARAAPDRDTRLGPAPRRCRGPLRLRRPLRLGGGVCRAAKPPFPRSRRAASPPASAAPTSRRRCARLRARALEPAAPLAAHATAAHPLIRVRPREDFLLPARPAGPCAEGRVDRDRAGRKRRACRRVRLGQDHARPLPGRA